MMSRFFLLPFVMLIAFSTRLHAQYMVIDSTNPAMYIVDLPDTTLISYTQYGCGTKYYYLDIDNNGITDFTFKNTCYMGGMQTYYWMEIAGGDSATIAVDTLVYDSTAFVNGQAQWVVSMTNYTMIKMYDYGDTLWDSQYDLSVSKKFVECGHYNYPSPYYYCTGEWQGEIHYAGIFKYINGVKFSGWIKINVPGQMEFTVMEYALTNSWIGFGEQSKNPASTIYPNPADRKVIIKSDAPLSRLKVYDISGKVVIEEAALNEKSIELSVDNLMNGIYFLEGECSQQRVLRKIVVNHLD